MISASGEWTPRTDARPDPDVGFAEEPPARVPRMRRGMQHVRNTALYADANSLNGALLNCWIGLGKRALSLANDATEECRRPGARIVGVMRAVRLRSFVSRQ